MNNINQLRTFIEMQRLFGHLSGFEYTELTQALDELEIIVKEKENGK